MRIARNLIPIALAVVLLFITAKLHLGAWMPISIASSTAIFIAMIVALGMRTPIAFAVLAVMLTATVVELAAHLVYGIHQVQGGATHITVLAAAAVGVLLGLLTKKAGANAGPDANAV